MKKTTKLQTVPVENEPVKPKRGPTKEKSQITVRLDTQLLDAAYTHMKTEDIRITDIIEEGIRLSLTMRNHDMPVFEKQARFILANATREQQILIRGLGIIMGLEQLAELEPPEKEKDKGVDFFWFRDAETLLFGQCKSVLTEANKHPRAIQSLRTFHRYGKTAQEIKKLAKLAKIDTV